MRGRPLTVPHRYLRVQRCRRDAGVSHALLGGPEVRAAAQQLGDEPVPQLVADAARFPTPVSTNRVGVASKQVWDSKRVALRGEGLERLGGDNA
jgi:hypothetical protein